MDRIYWQGASRCAQLHEQLGVRLQSWARDWGGNKWGRVSLSPQPDSAAPAPDSRRRNTWLLSTDDGAALQVTADDDAGYQLACSALAMGPGEGARLADEVGKHCMRSLLEALWGAGAPSATRATAAIRRAYASRHGGIAWRIEGLPGTFHVEVNGHWCTARLAHDPCKRVNSKLSSRRKAIADLRVPVEASIELGSIDLLESLQLRIGEVLLTDVCQLPRVRLATQSGQLHTGRIVAERSQRTVVVD